jgi:hypothetical protein
MARELVFILVGTEIISQIFSIEGRNYLYTKQTLLA